MAYEKSARTRIMNVLRGDATYHIPFTTYSLFSELSTFEREMREQGMGYVYLTTSYSIKYREAKVKEIHYTSEDGNPAIRTEYVTPYGPLYIEQIPQPELYTRWTKEHLFKSKEDYKAILWLIKDMQAVENYAEAKVLKDRLGEDFVIRDWLPLEPLQNLITSTYMDAQTFSFEWYDNRDEIIKLYDAFREFNRSIYPIVAGGPLEFVNYGGNVIPAIIGRENFSKYYLPNYEEAAETLHKKGKLIGSHLDDNNSTIMNEIASTSLDYIEAYDPGISPSLRSAFEIFKNKAIWINWPSAWHNESPESAKELTKKLISEIPDNGRCLFAITENMPKEQERILFPVILKTIQESGR